MKLNIGENIRRYRRERNLTQEALADKLGVSFQSVSRWENGTTYPDMEFLPALSRIFGVSADQLIGSGDRLSDEDMEAVMNGFCDLIEDAQTENAAVTERIRELRRDFIGSNRIWRIFGDMMYSETARWRDPDVMRELRITADEIMAYPHPTWLKNCMVQYMSAIEDEEHIDAFLDEYAADRDITRTSLLWERYTTRGEWEHLEKYRVHRLWKSIADLISDNGLWRNQGLANDVWESRRINESKLAILHAFCGTVPDTAHPVSGDGSVDLWAPQRVWMGIRHACYLASTGDTETAFVYLEDAMSLMEALFALPEGTALGCGCGSLAGLTLTLHHYRDSDKSDSAHMVQFIRYPSENGADIGYYGFPLHSFGIHYALTASAGWEWFHPIREDPRFHAYATRAAALMQ